VHQDLSRLSRECHDEALKGRIAELASLERQVDETAAKLWSIGHEELRSIQQSIEKSEKPEVLSA
jgi:hypothetical protein